MIKRKFNSIKSLESHEIPQIVWFRCRVLPKPTNKNTEHTKHSYNRYEKFIPLTAGE